MELRSGETRENMTTLELPEGEVNIFYGNHSLEQSLPETVEASFRDKDMLFLEMISHYQDKTPEAVFKDLDTRQYSEILKYARENSLPIFLPDSKIDEKAINPVALIMIIELMIAARLMVSVEAPETQANRKIEPSRRQFLRRAAKATGILLALPTISKIGLTTSFTIGFGQKPSLALEKISYYTHPELYKNTIVHFRNLLIAFKIIYQMKEEYKSTGKKQNIALVIGAGHIGIEDIFEKYAKDPTYFEKMRTELLEITDSLSESELCPTAKHLGRLQDFPDKEATFEVRQVL